MSNKKELANSLAQTAVEVNQAVLAMSQTYDALVKEYVALQEKVKELEAKQDTKKKVK